jgi:hypothetical protein
MTQPFFKRSGASLLPYERPGAAPQGTQYPGAVTRPRLLALLALALAVAAGCGGAAPGAVQGTLLVTPSGNDGNDCSASSPCASFDRAYRMAAPGQVVEVAAGRYPEQEIRVDPARTGGKAVVFRPQPGAVVELDGLSARGSRFEVARMTIDGIGTHPTASDITFRDIKNVGGIFVTSSRRIRFLGGSVGPGVDYHSIIGASTATPPRQILIDGVDFHDWTRSGPDVHTECLQIGAGVGITIRNSRFRNCDVFGLFVSYFGPAGPPRKLVIENNFFDRGGDGGFYSIRFANYPRVWRDVLVRHNSALQPINVDPKPRKVRFRIIGNVAPSRPWECADGVVYRYNVWAGARCDRTDMNAPTGFRNPRTLDLRLKAGAAAIDHVKSGYSPRDIEGQRRPRGKAADAGADEAD